MPLTEFVATVAPGEAVSSAVDLANGAVVRVVVPPEFSARSTDHRPSAITFMVSEDGVTFSDLHLADGTEVEALALYADTTVALPPIADVAWLRVRTGRRGAEVPQAEAASFGVVVASASG